MFKLLLIFLFVFQVLFFMGDSKARVKSVCVSENIILPSTHNSMTFKEAQSVMSLFERETAILLNGKKLLLELNWNENSIHASTTRDDNDNPIIKLSGGILRHPLMNTGSIIALLCHELGHHLGGAPRSFRGRSSKRGWSSAEGQADYFAGSKCIKLIFREDCTEQGSCDMAIKAASSLVKTFASIKGFGEQPKPSAKDRSVVSSTFYKHASVQCRLDTIIAGLKCEKDWTVPFTPYNAINGACFSKESKRPECWYYHQEEFR